MKNLCLLSLVILIGCSKESKEETTTDPCNPFVFKMQDGDAFTMWTTTTGERDFRSSDIIFVGCLTDKDSRVTYTGSGGENEFWRANKSSFYFIDWTYIVTYESGDSIFGKNSDTMLFALKKQ